MALISHMQEKKKKPKQEFLDETTESQGDTTEYLDDEFEEDELE